VTLSSQAARLVLQSLRCWRSKRARYRRESSACGVYRSFRVHDESSYRVYWFAIPPRCWPLPQPRGFPLTRRLRWLESSGAALSSSLALLWRIARPHPACRRNDRQLSWTSVPYSTFEAARSTHRRRSTVGFVPPSGFGHPLDGFLPLGPRRLCFAPTALLGFALRSQPTPCVPCFHGRAPCTLLALALHRAQGASGPPS